MQESGDAFVTKETLRNHTIQVKPEQSSPMEVVTHISRENIVIDLNQPYKGKHSKNISYMHFCCKRNDLSDGFIMYHY